MCFLGLQRLVEPFYNGFRDTPYWEDFPANYPLAQQSRSGRRGQLRASRVHSDLRDRQHQGAAGGLALGQHTAMDVLSNNDENATVEMWYRLLNCGFHVRFRPVPTGLPTSLITT